MSDFKPFEDGCPKCGYWQCTGCDGDGEYTPYYLCAEDDDEDEHEELITHIGVDFDILDQKFNHTISAVETNYVPNRDLGEHIDAALIGEDPAAALDAMEIVDRCSIGVLELYTLPDNNYIRVTKSDVRLMAIHFGLIEEE